MNNKSDKLQQESTAGGDEQIERLVYKALEQEGLIVPIAPEAVARAEARIEEEDIVLPPSLASFDSAMARAAEQRLLGCTPLPIDASVGEKLARAAREGGQIPPEVEQQMRGDRDAAEQKAHEKGNS